MFRRNKFDLFQSNMFSGLFSTYIHGGDVCINIPFYLDKLFSVTQSCSLSQISKLGCSKTKNLNQNIKQNVPYESFVIMRQRNTILVEDKDSP